MRRPRTVATAVLVGLAADAARSGRREEAERRPQAPAIHAELHPRRPHPNTGRQAAGTTRSAAKGPFWGLLHSVWAVSLPQAIDPAAVIRWQEEAEPRFQQIQQEHMARWAAFREAGGSDREGLGLHALWRSELEELARDLSRQPAPTRA